MVETGIAFGMGIMVALIIMMIGSVVYACYRQYKYRLSTIYIGSGITWLGNHYDVITVSVDTDHRGSSQIQIKGIESQTH